ncbi:MAG: dTMP kinase [Candidatus Marsarchaeota archaeon]|jgi:dTMP kinase|nr:dTMP kinase [Candidatus Marsarchaeota archaeon]MCL5111857.1 dTMP kinase [Candidatus Marsarchaeota archaeon]
MARGKLIVIEGIDGSGKSTQAKILFDELLRKGHNNVMLTAEPTNNGIGAIIRNDLKATGGNLDPRTMQLVFTADRSQHVLQIIEPRLANGSTVICDRYYYSTAAYAYAFGLNMEEFLHVNEVLFPKPSVVLIFDLPAEVAAGRIEVRNKKPERFENTELQKRVREGYMKLARLPRPQRGAVRVIDATASADEVHSRVMEEVSRHIS